VAFPTLFTIVLITPEIRGEYDVGRMFFSRSNLLIGHGAKVLLIEFVFEVKRAEIQLAFLVLPEIGDICVKLFKLLFGKLFDFMFDFLLVHYHAFIAK